MRHLRSLCLLILLASCVSSAVPATAAPFKRAGQEPAIPARFPYAIARGPDAALWFTELVAGRIGRITPGGAVREYSLPTPRSGPSGIVLGPDGALWFAEQYADRIGRLDPRAGSVREYVLPGRGFRPDRIVAGPDGALWFTGAATTGVDRLDPKTGAVGEYNSLDSQVSDITAGPDGALWLTFRPSHDVARLTTAGTLTSYNRSGLFTGEPTAITVGPDRALWFAQAGAHAVGRVGPGRQAKAFAIHQNGYAIAAGPDGNLWVSEDFAIGRISPAGAVQEFPLDVERDGGPAGIAPGPDRAMWFTEPYGDRIARISLDGTITRFPLAAASIVAPAGEPALPPPGLPVPPRDGASPASIARAPDGSVWFTAPFGNRLGRLTPAGTATYVAVPGSRAGPAGIAVAADGTVWFTEFFGGAVGRLDPASGHIRTYPLPYAGCQPMGIVVAADGAVWFTEYYDGRIGRLDPRTGAIKEFPLPFNTGPWALIRGPKGGFWFTERDGNAIGSIGADGTIRHYPLAAPSGVPGAQAQPVGLTAGPDGTLWFAEPGFGSVGSMSPAGKFRIFYLRDYSQGSPVNVATAPDGRIWYVTGEGAVGRLFDTGRPIRFPAVPQSPLLLANSAVPYDWSGLAFGKDGTLWVAAGQLQAIEQVPAVGTPRRFFLPERPSKPIAIVASGTSLWIAQPFGNAIARRAADGRVEEYPLPTADAGPSSLAVAPDGSVYFTEQQAGKVGRIDASGHIQEVALPDPGSGPDGATVVPVPAPSGGTPTYQVWFAERIAGRLGRLDPATGTVQEFPLPAGVTCPDTLAEATSGTLYLGFCRSTQLATVHADGSVSLLPGPQETSYGLLRPGPAGSILVAGEFYRNALPRLTSSGTLTDTRLPDTGGTAIDAATAPDGRIWFTEPWADRVGVLNPATAAVREFTVPTPLASPLGITVDASGTIWFTERDADAVASITPGGVIHEYPL